ncbi:hypothetical protein [Deinococcus budaensis]|uniref:Uncharacterized protein n=1 Tax=Deinococcus budaensis TaxID=1665626 RepID=A0A7W8GHU3_9DEIO|nr:hypothetical protein [Deinococcus budaensis]MBB5235538.1 hypothetical protein [Deinococcus budaensis]
MTRRWPSREELYDLVWSKPSEEVAADLGITGTALTRACARRNIPKPPRGYWARLRAGQPMKRVPLPRSETPQKKARPQRSAFVPPPVAQMSPRPRVVQRTERAYEGAQTDVWGRLAPSWTGTSEYLDLMVSRDALPRALQVMSRLIEEARASGMTVTAQHRSTFLEVGGEQVRLRLKEKVQAQDGLPLLPARSTWDTPSRQKAQGTGELSLLVLDPTGDVPTTGWRDGPLPLEDQVPRIIAAFRAVPGRAEQRRQAEAVAAERRRQQELETQRLRALEAQRQAELRRRREEEQACQETLLAHAQRWEEGQRLRAYLDWVRTQLQSSPNASTEAFQGWLAWAERELLALDPVRSGELTALTTRVQRMTGWPPLEEVIPDSRR